jgi:parallel beta-helix repeat protein
MRGSEEMNSLKSKRTLSIFFCVAMIATVFVVTAPTIVSAEEPDDSLFKEENGWSIDAEGTYFEITNSSYLNVTLTSSENVQVYLESIPNVVSYSIEANCTATSTLISLTGFEASKTYYRYQDGNLQEEFTTDETGSYSYTQDISTHHHVFIQEIKATIFIKSDGGVDPSTAPISRDGDTYTLTDNIYESIYIQKSGIILDGAGYVVEVGGVNGYGIYLNGISDVMIKNVIIKGFNSGIRLYYSDGNSIIDNTVSKTGGYGIRMRYSSSNIISGNTVSNKWEGISFDQYSDYNTIIGNTVTSFNYHGIMMYRCYNNIISGNTISWSRAYGIYVGRSTDNIISENTLFANKFGGTVISDSNSNTISGNTISGSLQGISPSGANSNTISGNNVSGNRRGFAVFSSNNNVIFHNNIINNIYQVSNSRSTNTWNNVDGEGNYWSDYTGADDGSGGRTAEDGIGDTNIPHPYIDQGWGYYQLDNYPLMNPWSSNEPPEILSISGPDPVQVNTEMSITGTFSDPDEGDTHTAEWNWGDETTSTGTAEEGTASGTHTYDNPGVYTVTLTVTDEADESDSMTYKYVVIYDPSSGFVTGGGWIDSPAGAYVADDTMTGKASFGFVSKYKKSATTPTGNTEFQFKAGGLNFHSDTYDWLVISGPKALFKGNGTINNEGNYGFMLTAIDGELNGGGGVDKFRIKIWDIDNDDTIVYDNKIEAEDGADPSTALGGGQIKIHKG